MDINDFISGKDKQQYQYKSFLPNPVNIEWQMSDNNLIHLLSEADIKLGELNAFSQLVPDIDFFIKMHIFKEATTSSRIEGTQTNIAEAVQKEEYIDPEKRDDWEEVQNYIEAMNEAIVELKKLPLSNRLLRNTHSTLLQGVRGKYKLPGEFRKSQNWIGGATLNDAVFIPPHQDDLIDLMSDFEKFLNNEEYPLPHLIRIGIAHYQFETLHPFLDGNGRIGRLLITLYLVSKGLLSKPTLYLSAFFEQNKAFYYDNLTRVRTHNDLTQWLKYFLAGIKQTAENSIDTFKSIIILRQEIEYRDILSLGRKAKLAQQFLHYLYSKPVIDSQEISKELSINTSTALRLIEDFINLGILKEITGYKRNRIFVFSRYLKLFE
ncbi:MAG: Fic family protein [Candidatus Omnitrophica bacterium]|nr:Fic family protein [Candidatus Omnitrophota bacterium]MCG2710825.1 Fic family protein [Candidatus Omnitrophota bacterium]